MAEKVKVIACKVMENEILKLVDDRYDISFINYGYHSKVRELNAKIQAEIDNSRDYDYLVLGYGYCGGATEGIQAVNCPIIMPKTDDCVPLLMGSKDRYKQEIERECGTYFLNYGWIDHGSDALKDFDGWLETYGEKNTRWLINEYYKAYTRVAFIDSGFENKEKYLGYSKKVADFMKVKLDVLSGQLDLFRGLLNFECNNDNFILLNPQDKLEFKMFRA